MSIQEGQILWTPSSDRINRSNLSHYLAWLVSTRNKRFPRYSSLWEWSSTHLEEFWESIWQYYDVKASAPYRHILSSRKMPGARWFEGAQLNYTEHALRNHRPNQPAILYQRENGPLESYDWTELISEVARLQQVLREYGVVPGDRVVSYMPNIPQTIIAFLASASLGAIWSSCSPDFGVTSVIDRFSQIEPKVLFAVDGYQYNGKQVDKYPVIHDIQKALPSLERIIVVNYLYEQSRVSELDSAVPWSHLPSHPPSLTYEAVPFDHPLWILYSSGTTGLPKPIVQGHGGILLTHLASLGLNMNLGPNDRFFWFTTTGWMMWNIVVSGLLTGATILLYDGSPSYPDLDALWEFAEKTAMTHFGTSAAYLTSCFKAQLTPSSEHSFDHLAAIGSTGSPLPPEAFEWVYKHVKQDVWLAPVSGGTDVCAAFVGGVPSEPVRAGEMQGRALGARVEAFDEQGHPLVNEVGELVLTEPIPSMPLYFWNDPQGERLRESYFDMFPGIWRHGDWIKITERGTCIIYGRSDSTINRHGVRMGTSEIYRVVEALPEVADSLVIDLSGAGQESTMWLFVVLSEGLELTEDLEQRVQQALRKELSPRHVPDKIYAIGEVPRTLNGKKMEVPIKKILSGVTPQKAVNTDAMANPEALEPFMALASQRK